MSDFLEGAVQDGTERLNKRVPATTEDVREVFRAAMPKLSLYAVETLAESLESEIDAAMVSDDEQAIAALEWKEPALVWLREILSRNQA